ncbi:MAG TPA: tyrosine-type recombinase/integrase [Pyrinomonadaceae bacterium]|nr:tyrosine-type recombinase/integrase [Pyrinomonadaceae bacterium]
MTSLAEIFEQFLKERTYLKGSSPKTITFYRSSFRAYQRFCGSATVPTKADLNAFVTGMREKGMKTVTCNTYIRGVNSFLSWLHENGHISEHLKVKQLKEVWKVMTYLSDVEVKSLIGFKPKGIAQVRVWTIAMLCLDTGIRVEEALTLPTSKVDFDNLLITVRGKGSKERTIPFSVELRKVLFKYLRGHKHQLVFCTRNGYQLMYDNCRRDFKKLLEKLGITLEGSFHVLRRTFARNYVRFSGRLVRIIPYGVWGRVANSLNCPGASLEVAHTARCRCGFSCPSFPSRASYTLRRFSR